MNTFPSSNSLSVSVRVYRAMLVAYPKAFREDYEAQMVQVFRDSFRYAYRSHGIFGVLDLWLHIFADLLVTALIERIMERSQYMISPKVIRWGGVASVSSGLLWMLAVLSTSSPLLLVLALVLGLGGLAGLYSRQASQGERLGLTGFALGIIGTVLALATLWWGFTSDRFTAVERDPVVAAPVILILSLALVILGVGMTLLGVISWRAKNIHMWRGLPLGLGLVGTIQGMTIWLAFYVPFSQGRLPWDSWNFGLYMLFPAVHLLLGLGWMGLGAMLAIEGDAKVAQPPPASA